MTFNRQSKVAELSRRASDTGLLICDLLELPRPRSNSWNEIVDESFKGLEVSMSVVVAEA